MLSQPMHISEAGQKLTQRCEGCILAAYRDPVGVWTIGFGHTGADVHEGQHITDEQAANLLLADMDAVEDTVNALLQVSVTQGMFDALCDFGYNLGTTALRKSTLLYKVNAGDKAGAAAEFPKWVFAGGKELPGLVERRKLEQEMFLS